MRGDAGQVLAGAMRIRILVASAVAKSDEQRTNLFLTACSSGDADTVLQALMTPIPAYASPFPCPPTPARLPPSLRPLSCMLVSKGIHTSMEGAHALHECWCQVETAVFFRRSDRPMLNYCGLP